MSSSDVLASLRQVADRWVRERGQMWELRLQRNDAASTSEFMQEVSEQGWLPQTMDGWGPEPIAALTTLGQSFGRHVPSLFVPILAHSCGLGLIGDAPGAHFPVSGALATCPYGQVLTMSGAFIQGIGETRTLGGQISFLANVGDSGRVVFSVADVTNAQGEAAFVVELALPHPLCKLSSPIDTLGLNAVALRSVAFDQLLLRDCRIVAQGSAAEKAMRRATRISRFGMAALVTGILRGGSDSAREFAGLRRQGGKPIARYPEVSAMLSRIDGIAEQLAHVSLVGERSDSTPHWPLIRELAWDASDAVMQVFGGLGYMCPGLPESCWRNVRQAVSSFVD